MLIIGDLIEGKAIDLDNRGYGVVKYNNYIVFVKELLIDEIAVIEIIEAKKQYATGIIKELKVKSELRRDHHEIDLGATDLIFMTEYAQLDWQKKITEDTIFKIANLKPLVLDPLSDLNYFNYRNKTVFHILEGNTLKFGLYKKNIYELKELNYFSLASYRANEIINFLTKEKIEIENNVLKHLVIRTNEKNEALVTIVSKAEKFVGKKEIINALKKLSFVIGITLNLNTSDKMILSSNSKTLFKENQITLKLDNLDFVIDDRAFFQVNIPVIKKAFNIIKEYLKPLDEVIDLYSGVGAIGFYLADKVKKVTLVEDNFNNVYWANEFKRKHSFNHVDIIKGKAEDEIESLKGDILIVDPPRSGIHERLIKSIINKKIKTMFYLSCDIKTLARDLNKLKELYYIEKVYPLKMFFQTTSTETLVILKRY